MYVKANNTPASAPGDHVWEDESSVVHVPDDLGTQLLRIAGQFSEVLPTDPEHPEYLEPELQDSDDLDPEPEDGGDALEPESEDLIGTALEIPPRTGPKAGRDVWEAYANSLGVEVPEGAGREAIVKLLAEAGKPVDQN